MDSIEMVIIICCILFILFLGYRLSEFIRTYSTNKKIKRGIALEEAAASFLKSQGYAIVSHHEKMSYTLRQNNTKIAIHLESDYVVYKNNKTYLVEVKSGENTANIKYAATRRQLLEYYFATNYDGYILLDMNSKIIYEIEFPWKKEKNPTIVLTIFLVFVGAVLITIGYINTNYTAILCMVLGALLIVLSNKITKMLY